MIYFDNNSTTPLDPEVLKAMLPVLEKNYGNPSSKSHAFGWFAEELVNIAREQVASLINAEPEEIYFTSGATESNNLAIKGLLSKSTNSLRAISSKIEHSSVIEPLLHLEKHGLNLELLDVDSNGFIKDFELKKSDLISLMLANNEIGTIQDLEPIFSKAKKLGITTHCDASQAVGKIPVDVKKLNVDLLSISAHKIYGPKGIGALYINKNLLGLSPLMQGGSQEGKIRPGTLNVAGIVGLGKACQIAKDRTSTDKEHIDNLSKNFLKLLDKNEIQYKVNGSIESRIPGNINIILIKTDNISLISKLSTKLAISTSSACQSDSEKPSHVLSAIGLNEKEIKSSIRIGLGRLNTLQEVEKAVILLKKYT